MPLLSFVVPTLNRQAKVSRAVASILKQKFEGDFEVIIVDDGSNPPISLPPRPWVRGRRAIPA
jgi:glycosyltransferase involved in cell wall biosynthesis